MKKFILGFHSLNDTHLTEYPDKETARYQSEEWCEVEAETLEEAMKNYERVYGNFDKLCLRFPIYGK